MAKNQYKGMSEGELLTKLSDLKSEYFNLRFQRAIGKLENYRRMLFMRKDIARVQTEISRARKAAEEKNA